MFAMASWFFLKIQSKAHFDLFWKCIHQVRNLFQYVYGSYRVAFFTWQKFTDLCWPKIQVL